MCENINTEILNNGQYEVKCLKKEIAIEGCDLNIVIKQEFECDQCPETLKIECSSNCGHCNEMCGKDHKEHLINNSDERNIEWDPCENTVKNKGNVINPIRNVHVSDEPFQCEVCLKSFTADVLKQHTFQSDVRGKQLKKLCNLKAYLTEHSDQTKSFQCQICPKSFAFSGNLKQHMICHNDTRPFKCDQCPKTFKKQTILIRHMAQVHSSGGKFSCKICGKQFIFLCQLKVHITKHNNEKIVHCGKCDKKFKRQSHLIVHIKHMHATDKRFQCQICPKSFAFAGNLKQHMASHNEKRPFESDQCPKTVEKQVHSSGGKLSCNICGKLFTFHCQLKAHMSKHSDERNVHCDKCDKRFKKQNHLIVHMKQAHATDKSFQCQICPKSFVFACKLKQHMTSHIEKRAFQCDQCPKTFKTRNILINHEAQLHGTGGKFSCDVCGKLYVNISQLNVHMVRHSDQKNIHCDTCGASFKNKYILTNHVKQVHVTGKAFQCQICQKSFRSAWPLKRHMDSHDEKRPFNCDQCPKTFKAQKILIGHKAHVHSSGGKFPCDVCGKLFISLCHLKVHQTKHSDQRNVNCEKCDKRFKTQRYLTIHMKTAHATEKSFQCEMVDDVKTDPTVLYDPEIKRNILDIKNEIMDLDVKKEQEDIDY